MVTPRRQRWIGIGMVGRQGPRADLVEHGSVLTAGQWEPFKPRGLRTVLRAAAGRLPPPTLRFHFIGITAPPWESRAGWPEVPSGPGLGVVVDSPWSVNRRPTCCADRPARRTMASG